MLNLNKNSDFEDDNKPSSDDSLFDLGTDKDEEETDLEEDEDFDLDEEADDDVSGPVFGTAVSAGDDSEEDEDLAEEGDLEPILAQAMAEVEKEAEAEESEDEEYGDEEEESSEDDSVLISKSKIILAKQLLENIRENSARVSALFGGLLSEIDEERISIAEISDGLIEIEENGGKVVEGIFNGENMIGPDGKEYSVPANYASKSKLVEGDILKLTITDRGTFIYKQTKPIERRRIIGKLEKDANGNYFVSGEHKKFRVITASITYYKGVPGDKVVILVPVAGDSLWAAVENVIKSK